MSRAIRLSLFAKLPSKENNHSLSAVISMAATSEIVLPSILKYVVSLFRRVPLQTGHTIFSLMSFTIPGKETISEEVPSPTRNISSEPKIISEMTSSGSSSIGSYKEIPYLRAMERIMSNFRVSLILPRGTMPPSAIETDLSGMMVSILTSTMIPRPLQCGQ